MEEVIRAKRNFMVSLCDRGRDERLTLEIQAVAARYKEDGKITDAISAYLFVAKWSRRLRAKTYYVIAGLCGEITLHPEDVVKYLELSAKEYTRQRNHDIAGIVYCELGFEYSRGLCENVPLAINAYLNAEYQFKLAGATFRTEITTCRIALARLYARDKQYDCSLADFDRAISGVEDPATKVKLSMQRALVKLVITVPYGDIDKIEVDIPKFLEVVMFHHELSDAKNILRSIIKSYDGFETEMIVRAFMKKYDIRDRISLAMI